MGEQVELPLSILNGGTGANNTTDALFNLHGFDLDVGKNIPSNSNLNDYVDVGTYNVTNSATAATISNTPTTTSGYKLLVMYCGQNRKIQMAICSSIEATIYIRWRSSSNWYPWYKLYSNNDIIPISNGGTNGDTTTSALFNLGAFDLNTGTEIPSNSNLNNYTTIGTYYVYNSTVAATITNTPTTVSGYKLLVLKPSSLTNYFIQIAICNNNIGDIYIRRTSGTWGNWIRLLQTGRTVSIGEGGTGGTTATDALLGLGALDLGLGTSIPSSSNLNNYTTIGTYYCSTSSIAQTLTNCPITDAFKLIVSYTAATDRYIQIIIANASNSIYFRNYLSTGWKAWYHITATSV